MKTPRKILLEQYRLAEPKLDAIRRGVVAQLNSKDAKTQSRMSVFVSLYFRCSNKLWSELIFPCRRIWTGLAAIWVLLFIVNFSRRDVVSSVTGQPVHSQVVMISWQTQQRWMNELLADRSAPPEADHPRKAVPGPRTENLAAATV